MPIRSASSWRTEVASNVKSLVLRKTPPILYHDMDIEVDMDGVDFSENDFLSLVHHGWEERWRLDFLRLEWLSNQFPRVRVIRGKSPSTTFEPLLPHFSHFILQWLRQKFLRQESPLSNSYSVSHIAVSEVYAN